MERLDLFKAYFTQESNYYAEKLENQNQGKPISFNFWAGFLGIIWFCYRKMYGLAILIALLTFALSMAVVVVLSIFNPYDTSIAKYTVYIIWIFSFVILGFSSNLLYLTKAKKVVAELVTKYHLADIDHSKVKELREKGGTSITAALVCAGIQLILQLVLK